LQQPLGNAAQLDVAMVGGEFTAQRKGNWGQNTDSAKILEHIIYGLFFLYTEAPWLTRTYLSFGHTLDFIFEVLSAQHQFLIQGFTNCMDLPMIHMHAK
jgi:hypothetical protein